MDNLFFPTGDQDLQHLFARKAFMKGEIIISEKPFLSTQLSWNLAQSFSACEHCLRPIENAEETVSRLLGEPHRKLPYMNECCDIYKAIQMSCNCGQIYCSYHCMEKAWTSYHLLLCPASDYVTEDLKKNIKNLTDYWRDINPFAITDESFIYFLLKYLAIHILSGTNPDTWPSMNNYHILQGQYFDRCMQQISNRHMDHMRMNLKKIFNSEHLNACIASREQFVNIFKVLILMNRTVQTSSFEKWEDNVDRLMYDKSHKDRHHMAQTLGFLNSRIHFLNGNRRYCEGMAIYTISTMFPHSCSPNAVVEFPHNNHNIVVKALRPISMTEKITINLFAHLDAWETLAPSARKNLLLERFFMECYCRICRPDMYDSFTIEDIDEDDDDDDDDDDDEDEDDEGDNADKENKSLSTKDDNVHGTSLDSPLSPNNNSPPTVCGNNDVPVPPPVFDSDSRVERKAPMDEDNVDSCNIKNTLKRNQDEIDNSEDDDYDDRISASESSEDDATIVDESQSA